MPSESQMGQQFLQGRNTRIRLNLPVRLLRKDKGRKRYPAFLIYTCNSSPYLPIVFSYCASIPYRFKNAFSNGMGFISMKINGFYLKIAKVGWRLDFIGSVSG
ncbi:hypothetical protein ACKJPP_01760 [Neisseria polysaccharea]|uniref:hypothetical protein n=1 Tax=Neisseria polysaccharea TaxID=489 RepID=UPI00131DD82D